MKTLKLIQNINELKYLRNLYEKESLDTRHGYYTLTNFVRWFELNPRLDFVKVYVVEKTWRVNGFYIIEVSEVTVGLSRFLASPLLTQSYMSFEQRISTNCSSIV